MFAFVLTVILAYTLLNYSWHFVLVLPLKFLFCILKKEEPGNQVIMSVGAVIYGSLPAMLAVTYAPETELLFYAALAWGLMIFHLTSAYGRHMKVGLEVGSANQAESFGLKSYLFYWTISFVVFMITIGFPQLGLHPLNLLFVTITCYLMELHIVNYLLLTFSAWVMLWNVRYGSRGLLGMLRLSLGRV
mgnify:CR=1 FL=1